MNISKEMTFGEVLSRKPQAKDVFDRLGIHCTGCPAAAMETVAEGAAIHGLDPDTIVNELNRI